MFILFGLRRTGKTTLIRQTLANMTDADIKKAAFIQITAKNTLADVNKDLKYLHTVAIHSGADTATVEMILRVLKSC